MHPYTVKMDNFQSTRPGRSCAAAVAQGTRAIEAEGQHGPVL
jgi:hypothetical protein